MSRMGDLFLEFCAAIYPDDEEKQDKLAEEMMGGCGPAIPTPTVDSYREYYEQNGKVPATSTEDIFRMVQEFHASGRTQKFPALTLGKVCAALGIKRGK